MATATRAASSGLPDHLIRSAIEGEVSNMSEGNSAGSGAQAATTGSSIKSPSSAPSGSNASPSDVAPSGQAPSASPVVTPTLSSTSTFSGPPGSSSGGSAAGRTRSGSSASIVSPVRGPRSPRSKLKPLNASISASGSATSLHSGGGDKMPSPSSSSPASDEIRFSPSSTYSYAAFPVPSVVRTTSNGGIGADKGKERSPSNANPEEGVEWIDPSLAGFSPARPQSASSNPRAMSPSVGDVTVTPPSNSVAGTDTSAGDARGGPDSAHPASSSDNDPVAPSPVSGRNIPTFSFPTPSVSESQWMGSGVDAPVQENVASPESYASGIQGTSCGSGSGSGTGSVLPLSSSSAASIYSVISSPGNNSQSPLTPSSSGHREGSGDAAAQGIGYAGNKMLSAGNHASEADEDGPGGSYSLYTSSQSTSALATRSGAPDGAEVAGTAAHGAPQFGTVKERGRKSPSSAGGGAHSTFSGFFGHFRPSSPRNPPVPDAHSSSSSSSSTAVGTGGLSPLAVDRGDPSSTDGLSHLRRPEIGAKSPRRPSSVFEHVGNLFHKNKRDREKSSSSSSTSSSMPSHSRGDSRSGGVAAAAASEQTSPLGSGNRAASYTSSGSTSMTRGNSGRGSSDEEVLNDPQSDAIDHNRPTSIAYYSSPPLVAEQSTSPGSNPAGASPRGSVATPAAPPLSVLPEPAFEGDEGHSGIRPSGEHQRSASEHMEYLSSPLDSNRRGGAAPSRASFSSLNAAKRISALDRVLIQVTEDNERFSVVDISGLWSAEAIKDKMLKKLHYYNEDTVGMKLCTTEIGRPSIVENPMDDDSLLAMCMQAGDDKGSLKFLVERDESKQRHGSQRNSRADSISSRGSASESAPDSSSTVGGRPGLYRSRAANVRRIAVGSGDDARSPPGSARSPPGSAASATEFIRTDSPASERSFNRRVSAGQTRDVPGRIQQPTSWHEGTQYETQGMSPSLTPFGTSRRADSHSDVSRPMIHRAPSQPALADSALDDSSDAGHRRGYTEANYLRPQQQGQPFMHPAKSMEDLRGDLYSFEAGGRYPIHHPTSPQLSHGVGAPTHQPLVRQSSADVPIRPPPLGQDPRYTRHPEVLRPHSTAPNQTISGAARYIDGPGYGPPRDRAPSFGNMHSPPFADPRIPYGQRAPAMPSTLPAGPNTRPPQSPVLPYTSGYVNEFGARMPLQGQLPIFPNRPHTYHDQYGYQTSQPRPMQTNPIAREDQFLSTYFPNASNRQVAEFQRSATPLTPGQTVQEMLGNRGGPPPPPLPPGSYAQHSGMRASFDQGRPHPQGIAYGQPPQYSQTSQHTAHPLPNQWNQGHGGYPHSNQQNLHRGPHQAYQQQSQQYGVPSRPLPEMQAGQVRQPLPPQQPVPSQAVAGDASNRSRPTSMEDSPSAPTSARSSSSGPASLDFFGTSDGKRGSSSTTSPYSPVSGGELDEAELMKIRPLPRPPQANSTQDSPTPNASSPRIDKNDEESDTLKAALWASLMESVQAKQSADAANARKGESAEQTVSTVKSFPSDGSTVTASGTLPTSDGATSSSPRDPDEGTFASFASFDDDDNEASGTWAAPLQPSNDESGTISSSSLSNAVNTVQAGKRPELRVTIDSGSSKGPSASRTGSSAEPPRTSSPLSMLRAEDLNMPEPSSSAKVQRKMSFARRDSDWAFRPPAEQLYEFIDEFFPKHDLDKPVLETSTIPESPSGEESSPKAEKATESVLAPLPPSETAGASRSTRHKKSIRVVAQDRKRLLEKVERAEQDKAVAAKADEHKSLARRRSTRLWGGQVLEMTPGTEATAPISPSKSSTGDRPQFKWVKGELIGKGTYGRVYIALNASTGEMIAVKQVELPRTASDREDARQKSMVQALKSEIETLKDLDHPHIVAYLGFEETISYLSIFLEYVPGGSVGSCLRKHGQFEENTIKSFLYQILEGLAYLHGKGILHRDLKADNILVDFNGICKISDFGTVRRSDDIYGNVENMSLQGSIFWMAPEVVSLSKKGYSAKVDIWSLGCVVLEMFAGRRPWSDEEAVQAMFKIGAQRRPPPIPPNVRLSKLAAHFLKNCFEIDPNQRPTASRLLEHRFPSDLPDGWTFQQTALYRAISRPTAKSKQAAK